MRTHAVRSAALLILVILVALVLVIAAPDPVSGQVKAVEAPPDQAAEEAPGPSTQGTVWPSLVISNLFGGPSEERTHYIERYGVRTGFGSRARSAWLADAADFSFIYNDSQRDVVTLERRVQSRFNQRTTARVDNAFVGVSGGFRYFRQAAWGLDYLYAPSQIAGGTDAAFTGGNVGYVGRFNDAVDDPAFAITRATYRIAARTKAGMFRDKASLGAAVEGQERSGRSYASLLMGGGDVLGTDADRRAKLRWHGYESTVDQSTNAVVFTAAVRPVRPLNVEYELGYERFQNNAPITTFADVAAGAGIRLVSTTAEGGAEGGIAAASAAFPAHFIADSTVLRQSLLAGGGNDRVQVSAGGGWSTLTQETFTEELVATGYRQGEIGSANTFVTLAARPSPAVRVETYARWSETNRHVDRFLTNLRLNALSRWTYGAEVSMRLDSGRVTLTPGWTRRTATREIEFNSVPEARSLLRDDSESDELFVRTQWKIRPRVSLRATPSVLWAGHTATILEPVRASKVNVALSHVTAAGTTSTSAFYTIRTRRNDDLSFTGADGAAVGQDARGALHQLGIAGSTAPTEAAIVFWSYTWSRDEYSANLISSTTRRFDSTPNFYSRDDRQTYLLGSHTITVGTDMTPEGQLQYGVSYTATRTAGNTVSGLVLSLLPNEDGRLDNWYHTASARVERDLGQSLRLGLSYLLDYYSDSRYTDLTGGLNTLVLTVGYRF